MTKVLKYLFIFVVLPLLLNILATAFWDAYLKQAYPGIIEKSLLMVKDVYQYVGSIDYTEIARGNYERVSIKVNFQVLNLLALVVAILFAEAYSRISSIDSKISGLEKEADSIFEENKKSAEKVSLENCKIDIQNGIKMLKETSKKVKMWLYVPIFLVILSLFSALFGQVKDFYINLAIAHYNRCLAISAPHLTETKSKHLTQDSHPLNGRKTSLES